MNVNTFTFSKASQARFEHHGKANRKRGDTFYVETPYRSLGIYISNEGRSIRCWDRSTGQELK